METSLKRRRGDTNRPIHVTVIGAGATGLSWTGILLATGFKVSINDPRPDIQIVALSGLELIKNGLQSLGYKTDRFTKWLSFENKLKKSVQYADVVLECGPEDVEFKQGIFEKLERFAKPSALLLSSSSSIPPSVISKKMKYAGRMLGAAGPFKTLALGEGSAGFGSFLDNSGLMVEKIWDALGMPHLDDGTKALLLKQSRENYACIPVEDLQRERDKEQFAILKALNR